MQNEPKDIPCRCKEGSVITAQNTKCRLDTSTSVQELILKLLITSGNSKVITFLFSSSVKVLYSMSIA